MELIAEIINPEYREYKCPNCGNDYAISSSYTEVEDNCIYIDWHCKNCDCSITETFQLVAVAAFRAEKDE